MLGKNFSILAATGLLATSLQVVAADENSGLEEIIVTARKTAENLQRTPVAVTAMTAQMLDDRMITNLNQIDHLAPNMQLSPGFSGSSNAANFYIRGVGQTDFVATSDPGVALYLDGVYVGRTVGAALDAADIERIEVLRGPQGTLFGKNTIGGAINVITARPDSNPGGYVEGTVGNYGRMDARFSANLPLSDTLAARISGVTRNNDGFAKRVLDGVRLGDDNDIGGRAQLQWTPNEDFDLLLTLDGTHRRAHIAAHSAIHVAASGGGDYFTALTGLNVLDFPPSSDPQKVNTTSVRPTDNLDTFGVSVEANQRFGSVALKSITAYRDLDSQSAADFDGTLAIYNDQEVDQAQHQLTQELQLSGNSGAFKWIVGAYFLKEKIDEAMINRFYSYYAFLPYGAGAKQVNNLETTNYAMFSQLSYALTDKLTLNGGARWTYEKKESSLRNADLAQPFDVSASKNWDDVSPKIGIDYQASDDLMLYVSATRGFKSGSFNGRPTTSVQFTSYDPETVLSYEVGAKSQWFDARLRLNAAAFWMKYDDIQMLTGGIDSNGDFFFPVDNAGDTAIRGVELELQARPTEPLTMFASLGYADEEWKRIAPVAFVTEDTRLPNFSKWNASAGVNYELPLASFGSLILSGDYSHRSSYFQTTTNSPLEEENGYSLVSAHVSVVPQSGNWELKFWGRNLTDARYIAWAQDLIAIGDSHTSAWFGRPREYGVTLRVEF